MANAVFCPRIPEMVLVMELLMDSTKNPVVGTRDSVKHVSINAVANTVSGSENKFFNASVSNE